MDLPASLNAQPEFGKRGAVVASPSEVVLPRVAVGNVHATVGSQSRR